MQLISRKQLFDIAKTSHLGESEPTALDYKEFKSTWKDTAKKVKTTTDDNSRRYNSNDDTYRQIYSELKDTWLHDHKNTIKYVGEGSSRAAFALSDGTCLKIAMSEAGIAQNDQEVKNYNESKAYCFTQIFDYDSPICSSILTECCAAAKIRDFQKLFGLTFGDMMEELIKVFDYDSAQYDTVEDIMANHSRNITNQGSYNVEYAKQALKFWKNCLTSKGAQWEVMRALFKFYKEIGKKRLIVYDLHDERNWGLALRNGSIVLVILDYGFSTDVKDKHY